MSREKKSVFDQLFSPKPPAKCMVIAEIGVNHNGDVTTAKKLIKAAKDAGADVVKTQIFEPTETKIGAAPVAKYQKKHGFTNAMEMTKGFYLDPKKIFSLQKYAQQIGIEFFVSVFDPVSLATLKDWNLPALKFGSGELVSLPLLKQAASFKIPMIISTGMSTLSEVDEAVRAIESTGNKQIAILQCTSNYPISDLKEINLKAMNSLAQFGYPVGYSDHTQGAHIPVAAVALGARIIEKHLTLDKNMKGPDHQASMEPHEFKDMVVKIREVTTALGTGKKEPQKSEIELRTQARKGLASTHAIKAGEVFTTKNLAYKKPAKGIPAKYYELILGRKATRNIQADSIVTWEDVMFSEKN